MYLVHCVDAARDKSYLDWRGVLFTFRVALNDRGVAVWERYGSLQYTGYNYTETAARDAAKRLRTSTFVPFIDVSSGRPVTPAQAKRLTGMTLGAAALDKITEELQNGLHGPGTDLSNFIPPPREKKAKPAPEPKAEPAGAVSGKRK